MPAREGSSRGDDWCAYRDEIDDEGSWRRSTAGGGAGGRRRGTKERSGEKLRPGISLGDRQEHGKHDQGHTGVQWAKMTTGGGARRSNRSEHGARSPQVMARCRDRPESFTRPRRSSEDGELGREALAQGNSTGGSELGQWRRRARVREFRRREHGEWKGKGREGRSRGGAAVSGDQELDGDAQRTDEGGHGNAGAGGSRGRRRRVPTRGARTPETERGEEARGREGGRADRRDPPVIERRGRGRLRAGLKENWAGKLGWRPGKKLYSFSFYLNQINSNKSK